MLVILHFHTKLVHFIVKDQFYGPHTTTQNVQSQQEGMTNFDHLYLHVNILEHLLHLHLYLHVIICT